MVPVKLQYNHKSYNHEVLGFTVLESISAVSPFDHKPVNKPSNPLKTRVEAIVLKNVIENKTS